MEGLVTSSAAVRQAAGSRTLVRVLYGPALTLAVGLCAALPVIAALVRALHEGYQPVADRGIIATRSFDVFSSHTPLVGQYSFAGAVTGKLTYSFGPMLYWLLAPAAHVGAPQSFVWTMGLVNVACVVGAVALARRRGGVWLMVAAAVGIGLMCRSIAANNFYDIWNPSTGLFPLLALIFVGWSLACGDYRLLPVWALLASFELQLEDSFVPAALGVSAIGLVGVIVWWLRARGSGAGAPRVWPWALAAAVVFAICWTPPVVDQIAHEGNLGHVVEAATGRKSSRGPGGGEVIRRLGPTVGLHAVEHTVGVRPWWLVRPSDPFVRKRDVLHSPGFGAIASTALILGWLLVAGVLAARRRRSDLAAGAATALILCVAVYSIASATPTKRMLAETLGYTLWSATTVGMFTWLIALWAAVVLSGAEQRIAAVVSAGFATARGPHSALRTGPAALLGGAALSLAGLAGGVGAAAGTPDEHAFEFAALGTINARLGAVPHGHSVFLNARLDGLITPLRPELTYALRRRGVRALGNGAYLRTGHWYERAEHPYDYVVWVYDNGRLPVPDARPIARARIRSGGRWHTVEVALSRAPPQAGRPRAARPGRAQAASAARVAPVHVGGWSAPLELAGCAAAAPAIAYPTEGPAAATGRGAIVWSARARGCRGTSASVIVGALGSDGHVGSSASTSLAGVSSAQVQAVGASFGRLVVAVLAGRSGRSARAAPAVFQAAAGHSLGAPLLRGQRGAPLAISRAYLGDAAIATVVPGPAIAVRVERFFAHSFAPARLIPIAPGTVSALTVTLDYRSDALVVWQQNGAIYAHMLRASGRPDPTQRVGPSAPDPQLRALVSDNDHGMLAWSSTARTGPSGASTQVYLALSAAGVRFRSPRRLTSFADPLLAGRMPGSLALVRLSSENVLLGWTERDHGTYAVRTAPAVFAGVRPGARLSASGSDAVLADLAPGPAAEAIAVWRANPVGAASGGARSQLWAARTFIRPGDRPAFSGAEELSSSGPVLAASTAVDPASDRPLVAWLQTGTGASARYAVGRGALRYRPHGPPTATAARAGTHWLRITLAGLAGLALALGLGVLALRRRGREAPGPASRGGRGRTG